jgi:hypothetical protein
MALTLLYWMIQNYCRCFRGLNFQTGKNKIQLLTEYESGTQKVLLSVESMLQTGKQLQHSTTFILRKQIYFVVSGLKITGHGNPDNNLESHCISKYSEFLGPFLSTTHFIVSVHKYRLTTKS